MMKSFFNNNFKKRTCFVKENIKHKNKGWYFYYETSIGGIYFKEENLENKFISGLINYGNDGAICNKFDILDIDLKDTRVKCVVNSYKLLGTDFDGDETYILNTNKGSMKGVITFNLKERDIKDVECVVVGTWKEYRDEPQFEFHDIQPIQSNLFYFLTKMVKGIGGNLASILIENWEEKELERVIEEEPEKLTKIKGLKNKKLGRIITAWTTFKHLRTLSKLLINEDKDKGYTAKQVSKIYNHFKSEDIDNMYDLILENPYRISEIKNIGFKTVDDKKWIFDLEDNDEFRLQEGILYAISQEEQNGSSYFEKDFLYEASCKQLNTEDFELKKEKFEETLNSLEDLRTHTNEKLRKKTIRYLDKEKNIICLEETYKKECGILDILKERKKHFESFKKKKDSNIVPNIESYIKELENQMKFLFSEEQKDAIRLANNGYTTFTLTGYAGTGKSTISKAICNLLSLKYPQDSIVACALSGMAANRIKQTTGFPSFTIHSLLEFKKGSYTYNENNKLKYKVILIDECSMIGTDVFYSLLKAIDITTVVLLVGDPAQLPPIGSGSVFSDIIKNQFLPNASLTKIYRQGDDAVITFFANYIRNGTVPEKVFDKNYKDWSFFANDIKKDNEFKSLTKKEQDKLKRENSELFRRRLELYCLKIREDLFEFKNQKDFKSLINYFQVIVPMRRGILGTDYLNQCLQKYLNPTHDYFKSKCDIRYYKICEKLIQIDEKLGYYFKKKIKFHKFENNILTLFNYKNFPIEIEDIESNNISNWIKKNSEIINQTIKEVYGEVEIKFTTMSYEDTKSYPCVRLLPTKTSIAKLDGNGTFVVQNEIRVFDKVIHTKNINLPIVFEKEYLEKGFKDYLKIKTTNPNEAKKLTQRVYNGQLGIVVKIEIIEDTKYIEIFYPNEGYYCLYSERDIKEYVDLAYSLTIHKTQGSEFKKVSLPIAMQHYNMLNNQLLYTAVTRAKEYLEVLGNYQAFRTACTNVVSKKRNTILDYILQKD